MNLTNPVRLKTGRYNNLRSANQWRCLNVCTTNRLGSKTITSNMFHSFTEKVNLEELEKYESLSVSAKEKYSETDEAHLRRTLYSNIYAHSKRVNLVDRVRYRPEALKGTSSFDYLEEEQKGVVLPPRRPPRRRDIVEDKISQMKLERDKMYRLRDEALFQETPDPVPAHQDERADADLIVFSTLENLRQQDIDLTSYISKKQAGLALHNKKIANRYRLELQAKHKQAEWSLVKENKLHFYQKAPWSLASRATGHRGERAQLIGMPDKLASITVYERCPNGSLREIHANPEFHDKDEYVYGIKRKRTSLITNLQTGKRKLRQMIKKFIIVHSEAKSSNKPILMNELYPPAPFHLKNTKNLFLFVKMDKKSKIEEFLSLNRLYVYQYDNEGKTILHWTAIKNSYLSIDKILEHRPNVNQQDHEGYCAIDYALLENNLLVVKKLLLAGAYPFARIYRLNTCKDFSNEENISLLQECMKVWVSAYWLPAKDRRGFYFRQVNALIN